jgi:hypothetical protein
MRHEVIIKLTLDSDHDPARVEKQIDSLFNCGTVREAIADGLHLDTEPHFVGVCAAAANPD